VIVDCGAAWRATGSVAFVRDGKVGFFFLSFVLAGSAPSLSLSLSFSLFLSQPRPFFESCINKHTQKQSGAAFAVRAATPEDEAALARVLDACCCCCSSSGAGGGGGEEGNRIVAKDAFERKTDAGSAELYFHCTFSLSFLDENDARFSLPPFSLDQKKQIETPITKTDYGMLQHQQNMLEDYVRTGTYWAAIHENSVSRVF